MSRKHYQAFADKISAEVQKLKDRGIHPGRQPAAFLHLKKAAELFADVALEDNDRFDYTRFMAACGVPEIDEEAALVALQKEVLAH
jgi:MoxR-like ATPase